MKIIFKILLLIVLHLHLAADPIDEAIQHCFPNIPESQVKVKILEGGYSADQKYTLEFKDKKYVLKVYANSKNYDPKSELYMMQKAGDLGVGPKIIYIDKDSRYVVMEFIKGGTLSFDDTHLLENCIKIAQGIRKIHSIEKNPYPNVQKLPLYTEAYYFLVSKIGHNKNLDDCFKIMVDSYAALDKFQNPLVSIHGDLNPRNIFLTQKGAKFIDWSLTNWEDPFYDLAYFSMMTAYTPELEETLLETYLGRVPHMDEWKRFHIQKSVAYTIMGITCFYLSYAECEKNNRPYELDETLIDWSDIIRGFMDYDDLSAAAQGLYNVAISATNEARLIAEQYLR